MAFSDTSPAAAALQTRIQRSLGGAARLRTAVEMSLAARALAFARLRRQRPGASDAELRRELLRHLFAPGELPLPLR